MLFLAKLTGSPIKVFREKRLVLLYNNKIIFGNIVLVHKSKIILLPAVPYSHKF